MTRGRAIQTLSASSAAWGGGIQAMKRHCVILLALLMQVPPAMAEDSAPPTPPEAQPAKQPEKQPDKQPVSVSVGDQWTYDQTDEITGNLTFTYTNTVATVTDKEITLRLTRRGDERRGLVVFDTSWNVLDDGVWKFKIKDGGEGFRLPLAVGKEWRVSETIQNLKTGEFLKETGKAKVVGEESFVTQAGTFDTFKIVADLREFATADPAKTQQSTLTTWYAPAINRWVKRATIVKGLGRLRTNFSEELVDYIKAP
jgi:hypothetical protein